MNPREVHRNKRLTNFEILTVGRYFNSLNDYVNIEKSCKEYRGITNQYKYNPIPLRTAKERNAFNNVETYKLTNDDTPSIFQWLESVDKKIKDNNKEGIVIDMEEPIDIVFKKDIKPFKVNKSCYIQDWGTTSSYVTDIDEDTSIVRNHLTEFGWVQHYDVIDLSYTKIKEFSPSFRIINLRTDEIILPDTLEVLPYGLTKNLKLQRITIPSGVTKIEKNAFEGDSSLVYVKLNEGLRRIDENVFFECNNLRSINIPSTVTYIGPRAFYKCDLRTITFQEGINLKNLGYGTFCSNYNLKEITIPESVTEIGNRCFHYCSNLLTINIPTGVTSFGIGCFECCKNLTTINIPTSIISIENGCFLGCENLITIDIPTSVTSIGKGCFFACSNLKTINIPTSITSIEYECFSHCSNLRTINIPTSVVSIEKECFTNCNSLLTIVIPSSVTYIGKNCFYGCNNLKIIKDSNPMLIEPLYICNGENHVELEDKSNDK